MKKTFNDGIGGKSVEPATFLGKWPDGSDAFESANIYFTHLVRLERGKSVTFLYDPGKVWRWLYIPNYLHASLHGATM